MARLDVYTTPGKAGRGYVVDVQAQLLQFLGTRVVIPLLPISDRLPPAVPDLNPVFDIEDRPHILVTQAVATLPKSELKTKVASLDEFHVEVTRAMDTLLLGF